MNTPHLSHQLTQNLLYIRTSLLAIKHLTAQIRITKNNKLCLKAILWSSSDAYHSQRAPYQTELERDQRDLEMWERRWVEAGVGIVEGVAVRELGGGRGLPREILDMVGRELRRGEELLDPL